MSAQAHGGAAFPRQLPKIEVAPDEVLDFIGRYSGMSLRDYFAAKALAGICSNGIPGNHHVPACTAVDAYAYADAMLAARGNP